ncbi:hypothetical protein J2848_004618 [Azospirillum lipoferum]|uniref:Uncharacterized protein n=1 Tax=Azospirillum lipoferum TaxID=193 RepID=A0A5A9GK82_AZOLI|nr:MULTISPECIES: hypothetical protein [Azospirillum]KAA0594757.1 hypothetical protein FZ942_18240 [Azospirillum lipoferum]MCP1612926.1 hypothetical protein [Azospirillum lipoferum]MDW5532884.1 hypothetical protein [Azospirillum sp. NL1]
MSKRIDATDRHHGGPGSSQQNADKPEPAAEKRPHPGEPTNTRQSGSSSGGGERDLHHTHDPRTKR